MLLCLLLSLKQKINKLKLSRLDVARSWQRKLEEWETIRFENLTSMRCELPSKPHFFPTFFLFFRNSFLIKLRYTCLCKLRIIGAFSVKTVLISHTHYVHSLINWIYYGQTNLALKLDIIDNTLFLVFIFF